MVYDESGHLVHAELLRRRHARVTIHDYRVARDNHYWTHLDVLDRVMKPSVWGHRKDSDQDV